MEQFFGPVFKEALTIIGILLNVIIGLLLYIFQQQNARNKEELARTNAEMARLKEGADGGLKRLEDVIRAHEDEQRDDRNKLDSTLEALRRTIADLHVTLPSEYVKQTVLAAMQLDIKADIRSVFGRMDELKSMMISMGADRRER